MEQSKAVIKITYYAILFDYSQQNWDGKLSSTHFVLVKPHWLRYNRGCRWKVHLWITYFEVSLMTLEHMVLDSSFYILKILKSKKGLPS